MRALILTALAAVAASSDEQHQLCPKGCRSNPGNPQPAPKGAKNVLFLAVDDLRPELEVFGGVPGTTMPKMHTPNINELASKSLVLTKNYVQQAVCSPTRQSLLTSRRPDRTRVYDLYSYFRDVGSNFTTIPEWFRMNGYHSIGLGKIFHPGHASGSHDPDTQKVGEDVCCSWSNDTFYYHPPNLKGWTGKDKDSYNKGQSWMAVDPDYEQKYPLPDTQTTEEAVKRLHRLAEAKANGDEKPFFLAVGYHLPHLPFAASQKYFDLYPKGDIEMPSDQQPPRGMPSVAWNRYGELLNYADQAKTNNSGKPGDLLPHDDIVALRRAYYASVSMTDDLIGNVLATLKATGLAENTVISFFGDHGWQLGEHGEWCKHTNFEFAARAPMLVSVPGVTDSGLTSSQYTEHVDLFPTLTEAAAGVKLERCPAGDASFGVKECTEGTSLVPLMKSPHAAVKTASFSQYPRPYQEPGAAQLFSTSAKQDLILEANGPSKCITSTGKGCTMGYSVVTTVEGYEYRYTEWADFNTEGYDLKVNWDRIVGVELYNHSADPGENYNINVTRANSDHVKRISAHLSKILHAGPQAAYVEEEEEAFVV